MGMAKAINPPPRTLVAGCFAKASPPDWRIDGPRLLVQRHSNRFLGNAENAPGVKDRPTDSGLAAE
jgi:hypothetical protein